LYDGKGFLPLPFIFANYFANENYTLSKSTKSICTSGE
jgi:hypothetical protein